VKTLLIAIVLLQAPAQAPTGAVNGLVRDFKGAPLAGVAVSLGGQPLKAPRTIKTDADGAYLFTEVPDGEYTLSFRSPGLIPANVASVTVAGLGKSVNLAMRADDRPPRSFTFTTRSTGNALAGLVPVRVETSFGNIDIAVDTNRAPITSANFLKYVDAGLYDGGRFNRATRPDNYNTAPPNRPMMELIQGGLDPAKRDKAFPAIPLERTSVTGMTHVRGIVSMARGGPDSATSEFFILLDDQPSLDFGGKRFDDNQGAGAFGYVIAGLDVVERIQQQPVEGQNLTPAVKIISVKRVQK
jgi:peptidyl-prolyl cis-trans isomerase A (cyclophilin A)